RNTAFAERWRRGPLWPRHTERLSPPSGYRARYSVLANASHRSLSGVRTSAMGSSILLPDQVAAGRRGQFAFHGYSVADRWAAVISVPYEPRERDRTAGPPSRQAMAVHQDPKSVV